MLFEMISIFFIIYIGFMLYYRYRPIKHDIDPAPRDFLVKDEDVQFLYDLCWYDNGRKNLKVDIRNKVLDLSRKAKRSILIDVFLFNDHHVAEDIYPPITKTLSKTLADSKAQCLFITDPINIFYGARVSAPITWLRAARIQVCMTDLDRLRDHNPIYSGLWRMFLQWWPIRERRKSIQHPMKVEGRINYLSAFKALNAKANHRKVFIFDQQRTIIASANMNDASSYFSNVGVLVNDKAVSAHFLHAELEVARMSGCDTKGFSEERIRKNEGEIRFTPLLGKYIRPQIIQDINSAKKGDEIRIGMLFISDRGCIRALKRAARRGVKIMMILDDNLFSFGKEKRGIPNQPVAAELSRYASIRFYNSPEEYHSKIIHIKKKENSIVHLGSANLTHKSLSATNLEANARIAAKNDTKFIKDVENHFKRIEKEPYSSPYGDDCPLRLKIYYWIEDVTRFSTF